MMKYKNNMGIPALDKAVPLFLLIVNSCNISTQRNAYLQHTNGALKIYNSCLFIRYFDHIKSSLPAGWIMDK